MTLRILFRIINRDNHFENVKDKSNKLNKYEAFQGISLQAKFNTGSIVWHKFKSSEKKNRQWNRVKIFYYYEILRIHSFTSY